ncbi:hypothetical protein SLOPH_1794 [Spraguea lophii 42_110]|uniref:Uncharacterized protein n=1 Tax=Spraguea lophii (strain 42_110) TaxID=1358809 RepID=S7WAQ8_SPRLO|nr:hypothetical protein SLOPH_1794 [Spraguea lophii 42_110]
MNAEKLDKIIHEDFNDAIIGKYIFYHKTRTVYKDDECVIYIMFFTEGLAIVHNKVEEIIKPENIKDIDIKDKYIKLKYKINHTKKLKINFKNRELMERSFKLIQDIKKLNKKEKKESEIKIEKDSDNEMVKSLRVKKSIKNERRREESIIDRILDDEIKYKETSRKNTKGNSNNKKQKNIEDTKKNEKKTYKSKETIDEKEHIKSKLDLIDYKKTILSQHQIKFGERKKEDLFFRIEFNDLRFFISSQKQIENIKKKSIARIGKYFYPEKQIIDKMIDLKQYEEFKFYIKDKKKLYHLEIEEDLISSLHNLGNKLNIIIKLDK